MLRLAVTGHRPDKLGGYSPEAYKKLVVVAYKSLEQLKPRVVITGMALGWDQAIAEAAYEHQIPFIAAIPFKGQESKWPKQSQEKYRELLKHAHHQEICSPGEYRIQKMQIRNEWMIDNCDEVLALYNGDKEGGTFNCVQYARVRDKVIYNAWDIFTGQQQHLTRMYGE